ncbi:hypothetical protein [Rhizobium leguminosarum]|uniref:hypothetical protein n=1 Tax=Rhizobium leguminosarum TaxID=384 RepID=UPI00143F6FE1|nr:hypothetical protein [Rhizobium leguminosarum]NKL24869.1 hypothetical protein [Rhizobium leguminosarum bv. viciae]NKL60169.1 hypothetical protein [Rhizobium leguminosarum bv. viciae]
MKALILKLAPSSRLSAIRPSSAPRLDMPLRPPNRDVTSFSSRRLEGSFVNSQGVKYKRKMHFLEKMGIASMLKCETLKCVGNVAIRASLLFGSGALALGLLLPAISAKENERSLALLSSSVPAFTLPPFDWSSHNGTQSQSYGKGGDR